MVANADKPIVLFETPEAWEQWLEADPDPRGVRLQLRKKYSTRPGITYPEALDVALCHGWIDGQIQRCDDDYSLQAFTPRRARSPWSKVNQGHVARLIEAGRMRPAGQAEIDRAKADGRWDAAYQQKGSTVPADLRAALDANTIAATGYDALTSQERFGITFRLDQVKRAETRQRKIATYVEALAAGTFKL